MSDRAKIFGDIAEPYFWCLHCERTYPKDQFRKDAKRGLDLCHYQDCSGDAVLDAWAWSRVREGREDRYPEHPEKGVRYPLYDET